MALTIGEKLKKKRNELGYTLKELGEKCGILPQLISDYENGRKDPGVKNLKLLCEELNLSFDYLLDDRGVIIDNQNTYGNVLSHYYSALKLSINDKLVIDRDNNKVYIEINDDTLRTMFIQVKDFVEANEAFNSALMNFYINILSNVEIKKNEDK